MYINKKGRATWFFLFVNYLEIIALWQWCHYFSLFFFSISAWMQ